ncbi:Ig-like domain-containing protein, partial [Streptomyces melanosporofaciens]
AGTSVDFVAFVEAIPPGDGTPTGLVTFILTNVLNLITVSGPVDSTGFFFAHVGVSAGTYSVTASYSGDDNFNGSTSPTYTQVIT